MPQQVNVASLKSLDYITFLLVSLCERSKRSLCSFRTCVNCYLFVCSHPHANGTKHFPRKQKKKSADLTKEYDAAMETFREDRYLLLLLVCVGIQSQNHTTSVTRNTHSSQLFFQLLAVLFSATVGCRLSVFFGRVLYIIVICSPVCVNLGSWTSSHFKSFKCC